jgi:hypothetical protein
MEEQDFDFFFTINKFANNLQLKNNKNVELIVDESKTYPLFKYGRER